MRKHLSKTRRPAKTSQTDRLNIASRIGVLIKKRPYIAIVAVVAVIAIGTISYQVYGLTGVRTVQTNSELMKLDEKSKKNDSKDIDNAMDSSIAAPVTVAPAQPKKEPVTPKSSAGSTAQDKAGMTSSGVMSKPGCYAGCATANPGFSIQTIRAVTVAVGGRTGTLTASTSNGASVKWTTPQYNDGGFGPFGYTMSTNLSGPSLQYYIEAGQNVAPGTYTLYMSAIQGSTQTLVRTTIVVTVLPADSAM